MGLCDASVKMMSVRWRSCCVGWQRQFFCATTSSDGLLFAMDAATAAKAKAAGCPVAHGTAGADVAAKCPVSHDAAGAAAAMRAAAAASTSGRASEQPPANSELQYNQKPAPGQRAKLPTERAVSSIPTATGDDPLWVYPSQQMFYNAMRRKGYAPQEEEMDAVVAIHNAVNERAWAEVCMRALQSHTSARRARRCTAAAHRSDRALPLLCTLCRW